MADEIDFAAILEAVATELWGKPTTKKGRELRFGSHGSRSVDLAKGTWFDHQERAGGGTLDLITRETGLAGKEAMDWLAKRGLVDPAQPGDRKAKREPKKAPVATPKRQPEPEGPPADEPPPPMVNPQDEEPPFAADAPPGEGAAAAPPPVATTTPRQLVASYDYTDFSGALLYQVQRWEWVENGKRKKNFSQRRPSPDEAGVWINGLTAGDYMRRGPGEDWSRYDEDRARRFNLNERTSFGGTPHGLYRLIELREAIAGGEVVFLPEGEKKVEALASIGISGSCNSGGAANWSPEHAEIFRDADVVVAIDNDEPGRKRGQDVAASLYGVARRVRVLDFAAFDPRTPVKYDVADWIEAGGDAERLFGMIEKVQTWEPPKFKSRFNAVPWADLDAPGPEHEWLVKGILTRHERSMMAGASQSGKSFLAIDIAMAVARGVDYLGRKTTRGGVIYQAGEGGRGVKKRLRAYRIHHGIPAGEPLPFVLLPSPVDLYAGEDQTEALIAEIRHWSASFPMPLEMVVIDTLSAATPGANENASEDMSRVLARCERIAAASNAHVMIVHHMNAEGSKPRGHTSIFANLDNVITVTKVDGMRDHSEQKRPIREARVTKQKDGEDGFSWRFVLPQVQLGHDGDGDPITSCVVAPPDMGAMAGVDTETEASIRLSAQGEIMLRAIYAAIDKAGEIPPPELRLPAHVRVVKWKEVSVQFRALSFDEGDDEATAEAIRKAMERHGTALLKDNVIGRSNPFVWLTGRRVKGFRVPMEAERQPAPKAKPVGSEPLPATLTQDDILDFVRH
jgi:hypothetical protein